MHVESDRKAREGRTLSNASYSGWWRRKIKAKEQGSAGGKGGLGMGVEPNILNKRSRQCT